MERNSCELIRSLKQQSNDSRVTGLRNRRSNFTWPLRSRCSENPASSPARSTDDLRRLNDRSRFGGSLFAHEWNLVGRKDCISAASGIARPLPSRLYRPCRSSQSLHCISLAPARLDRYPRGFTGHVADPSRSIHSRERSCESTLDRGDSCYFKRAFDAGMNEIIFVIEEAAEGGFIARALGESIFTEADTLDALRQQVRDAVNCHFDDGNAPKVIRLHFVRDEVLAG